MRILDWFSGFATIGGFLYFFAGFVFAYVFRYLRCKMRHKRFLISWQLTGITIGLVVIIVTSVQTQIAYTTAKETAVNVQNCQREFNAALAARSSVTRENDQLSQDRSLVVVNWIHDLLFPPAPYDVMNPDDPRRQEYSLKATVKADRNFKDLITKQNALLDERERHPLPDPTCGR